MKIRKDDTVVVVAGNNKGKTGKVLKVFPKQGRVIVEGVNLVKKSTKPSQQIPQGGIIEKEGTIAVSNVMVIDPKTNEPTRVGTKIIIDEKSGKKRGIRVSKISGEMLS